MRDHGGNLDAAVARFGGTPDDWIDLSTGINRLPYPLPQPPDAALRALPGTADLAACAAAACAAYGAGAQTVCLPLAGAQAAIRLVPALRPAGSAGILGPTYNEHAAAFRAAGWQVTEVCDAGALAGFDAVVLVNPNNPDGRRLPPDAVLALAGRNGLLVVDESFADVDPAISVCLGLPQPGVIVLRSFGKFYGLAGVRLGFVIGPAADIALLDEMAGPWPVNGAALRIGGVALADRAWAEATTARLRAECAAADALAVAAGWQVAGGCELFRLYDVPDAVQAQERLARHRIWSRIFPWSNRWLRLGLPGGEAEWARLAAALTA